MSDAHVKLMALADGYASAYEQYNQCGGPEADCRAARDTLSAALREAIAQPQAAQPEACEEIQELRAQVEAWRKQCDTLTHQVICCGVAATHPDATLTTRGAYAGKAHNDRIQPHR